MFSNVKTKAGAAIAAAALVAGMMPVAAFATQPEPGWQYAAGYTTDESTGEQTPNDSHPQTDLYLLGNSEYPIGTDSNADEAQANFKVAVPTRINYVLSPTTYASTDPETTDSRLLLGEKKILGPSNVFLTNHSGVNAHVSDLTVTASNPFQIVTASELHQNIDNIFLQMNGENLADYTSSHEGGLTAGNWNIPSARNNGVTSGQLTFGTSGAWDKVSVDPTVDNKIGEILFTIAPGTATA